MWCFRIFNKLCYFYDWCESFETPHLVEEIESLMTIPEEPQEEKKETTEE